jgi:hypothetical protein
VPILQIEHAVRDFDAWQAAFESDPVGREAGGVRRYRVLRPVDDPAYVLIELEFDTAPEAEAFLVKLRTMWEAAGPRLGFESPRTRIVEVVETTSV